MPQPPHQKPVARAEAPTPVRRLRRLTMVSMVFLLLHQIPVFLVSLEYNTHFVFVP